MKQCAPFFHSRQDSTGREIPHPAVFSIWMDQEILWDHLVEHSDFIRKNFSSLRACRRDRLHILLCCFPVASLDEGVVNVTREVESPVFPSPRFKNALKRTSHALPSQTQRCSAGDNMAVKRICPWDYCDNVEELKRMLNEKDEQLQRVMTEKDMQVAALERKLKSAKKSAESSPAGADGGPSKAFIPKQLETQVNKLRRSIWSQVANQMSYKPSTKHGSAKLVSVEIFDVDETVLKTMFGETLMKEVVSGPKQLKVIATNEEVKMLFEKSVSKSLWFGATLELTKGLNFAYQ